jgi:excisionase family DNA binding protein
MVSTLTVQQAAEQLGIAKNTLYGMIKAGRIPGVLRVGGGRNLRIAKDVFHGWIQAGSPVIAHSIGTGPANIETRSKRATPDVIVFVADDELMAEAERLGLKQYQEARARAAVPSYEADPNDSSIHVLGVAGILVAAEITGLHPDFFAIGDAPNLGESIQVRTAGKHHLRLIFRPDERRDRIYVFITTEDRSVFHIHGWAHGHECINQEWLRAYSGRPPAYFVPSSALHSMDTLPGIDVIKKGDTREQ